MTPDILISIRKQHCDKIFLPCDSPDRKTLEVRLKALPRPCRCWVVETGRGGCRGVIGVFMTMARYPLAPEHLDGRLGERFLAASKLTRFELEDYMQGRPVTGADINTPVRLPVPVALGDLDAAKKVTRPPQSWQYITFNTTPYDY